MTNATCERVADSVRRLALCHQLVDVHPNVRRSGVRQCDGLTERHACSFTPAQLQQQRTLNPKK
jgi:hypothetical protein